MCVCEREGERGGERERGNGERGVSHLAFTASALRPGLG